MSICRDASGRNDVVAKMWALASSRNGNDTVIIRHARTKEIVPNRTYQWSLYEHKDDQDSVEKVILDVNLEERLLIDDEVGVELDSDSRSK